MLKAKYNFLLVHNLSSPFHRKTSIKHATTGLHTQLHSHTKRQQNIFSPTPPHHPGAGLHPQHRHLPTPRLYLHSLDASLKYWLQHLPPPPRLILYPLYTSTHPHSHHRASTPQTQSLPAKPSSTPNLLDLDTAANSSNIQPTQTHHRNALPPPHPPNYKALETPSATPRNHPQTRIKFPPVPKGHFHFHFQQPRMIHNARIPQY